jgi:hypothetical protein
MRSRGSSRAISRRASAIVRCVSAYVISHLASLLLWRVFASARILAVIVGKPISSADGVNLLADRIRAFFFGRPVPPMRASG